MSKPSFQEQLAIKPLVLDGALGTQLEQKFKDQLIDEDLNIQHHPLWSALILLKKPQLIQEIHYDYLNSGADIITTATYQASTLGLQKHASLSTEEIRKCYEKAVDVGESAQKTFATQNVAPRPTYICGSVGPYGGFLANGAEYTGEYNLGDSPIDDLKEFHRGIVEYFLNDPRVDLLAFETIPNFNEAIAILKLMTDLFSSGYKPKPFYLSFNFKDKEHICDGTTVVQVVDSIQSYLDDHKIIKDNLVAYGANCIQFDQSRDIIASINNCNTSYPLVVYPNAGLEYDLKTSSYVTTGVQRDAWKANCTQWIKTNNVKIMGGCCGTGPSEITAIRECIDSIYSN
ncbi:homocysteine S-methyltransferase 1 [[Candida] anglica]|uniref:Homocysteine S-methyltransferase 1 n=1 Tax=[Candida] anglica TaxID=148631 RepID=A0ABP0EHN8_9ASCO